MNPKDNRTAVKMYREGKSIREIAKRMGRGRETIRYVLHRAGVAIRRRGRPTDVERDEEVVKMALEGYALEPIGDHFGITKQRVSQIILDAKKRGLL